MLQDVITAKELAVKIAASMGLPMRVPTLLPKDISCHRVALLLGTNPTMLGVAPSSRASIQATPQVPADRSHLIWVLPSFSYLLFVRRELERSNPFFFAFHEGGQQ